MAHNENVSPLMAATPDKRRYPAVMNELTADIVIVGGGIAGVMTAWRLAAHGQSVVLLEQNHLATGDTGLTTAFVTRVPDTPLGPLAKRYGQAFVHDVFQATREAQQYLHSVIDHEAIRCDWTSCNSYNVSYVGQNSFLRDEWSIINQADSQTAFVTAADDPNLKPPLVEAIRFNDEAYFTVRKFIFGLLDRPAARAIKVFEESPVHNVLVDRSGVTVTTNHGRVRAKKVIITTGLPFSCFPELRTLFTASLTYAIAARYEQALPISHNIFWDTDQPYQYYRPWDGQTVILGGADRPQTVQVDQPAKKPHAMLAEFLKHRFPGPHTVTNHWSGSLFATADGLPYIAEHPHYRDRVFVASGFDGSGMVMGALSGMILGDLASGQGNVHAHLFDFSRSGVTIAKPPKKKPGQKTARVKFWQWILPFLFAAIFVYPAYIFFSARGGIDFLPSADFKSFGLKIFPLVGLYAFTLVWFQLIIGSSMDILRRVYSWIESWHRTEGVFVLLFALLHPTLLIIGIGPVAYWTHTYIDPSLVIFIWLGVFQLLLICLTAGTALLQKTRLVKKYWRTIHYLNYLVFVSVWIHSWFLGSDVQSTNLKYVWMFFGATAIVSTLARIIRARRPALPNAEKTTSTEQGAGIFSTVANVDQVQEGRPLCITINNRKISVFKFGDKFYAIDNTCSHAGGPLCDGIQMGGTIECPLHQSVFDITTGAVKEGPATMAQQTYEVRVEGQAIKIKGIK